MYVFLTKIMGSFFHGLLKDRFRPEKSSCLKKLLRDTSGWSADKSGEIYFYKKDPEYKIEIGEAQDTLSDRYKKFKDTSNYRINLVSGTYNGSTLLEWSFMYLDGYRIFVPIPKTGYDTNDSPYDYYDLSNEEINVFKIIGEAKLMPKESNMEGLRRVARMLKIIIATP